MHAYVHVPFCPHLCSYCAFDRTLNKSQIPAWLERIEAEISDILLKQKEQDPGFELNTIYFGGGTPSMLDISQLKHLARLFWPCLPKDKEYEWTLEVNPETVDLEKLKEIHDLGINRLSAGIQSFDDESLKRMNRHHTADQAKNMLMDAKQAGFDNISADLIFALPWQSMEDLKADLNEYLFLGLDHISIYSLQIEENSVFGKKNLEPIDEDLEADMYEYIEQTLEKAGYIHYEISSFARPGRESRHNLAYWQDEMYLGFGYGAAGYDELGYYHHAGSLENYISAGYQKEYDDDLSPAFAAIMMGLRTSYGLNIKKWESKYQQSFSRFDEILAKYAGKMQVKDNILSCTDEGMEILNTILVDFLEVF